MELLGKTETYVVAAGRRRGVAAGRHATAPRAVDVDPAAATVHTVRATGGTRRVGLRTAAVTAVPVLAPLPHVAAHVVQTQLVSLLRAHRLCAIAAGAF